MGSYESPLSKQVQQILSGQTVVWDGEWTDKETICTHCDEAVEFVPGVGWVEVAEGGHYDICPEAGDHYPEEV